MKERKKQQTDEGDRLTISTGKIRSWPTMGRRSTAEALSTSKAVPKKRACVKMVMVAILMMLLLWLLLMRWRRKGEEGWKETKIYPTRVHTMPKWYVDDQQRKFPRFLAAISSSKRIHTLTEGARGKHERGKHGEQNEYQLR